MVFGFFSACSRLVLLSAQVCLFPHVRPAPNPSLVFSQGLEELRNFILAQPSFSGSDNSHLIREVAEHPRFLRSPMMREKPGKQSHQPITSIKTVNQHSEAQPGEKRVTHTHPSSQNSLTAGSWGGILPLNTQLRRIRFPSAAFA